MGHATISQIQGSLTSHQCAESNHEEQHEQEWMDQAQAPDYFSLDQSSEM